MLGDWTPYTYQLDWVAGALRSGELDGLLDGSVANAELIDECYRRAGLEPRGRG